MAIEKLSSVDFDKMLIKSYEEFYGYDPATGELLFLLDELKSGDISGEENETEVEGKSGNLLYILRNQKRVNVNFENAYIVASALAAQMGTEVITATSAKTVDAERQEIVKVAASSTTLTLTNEASGNGHKVYVYVANSDGSAGSIVMNDGLDYFTASQAGTDNKYIQVTLSNAPAADTNYLVTYVSSETVAKEIINKADDFGKTIKAVVNMIGEDVCTGKEYLVQAVIPKLILKGTFNVSASGTDPATMTIEGSAVKTICGTGNENGELCHFVVC